MSAHKHTKTQVMLLILVAALTACTSQPVLETTSEPSTPASGFSDPKVISSANASQVIQVERLGTGWLPDEDDLTLFAWASQTPRLAVVSSAGLMIYDPVARQELRFIETPSQPQSFAFSSQGQTVVAGSEDGTITLWDVTTGQPLQTFRGSTSPIIRLVFSPDDQWLVSADAEMIKLWEVATGRELKTFSIRDVQRLNFINERMLVANNTTVVKIWDVRTGRILYESKELAFQDLALSPDKRMLALKNGEGDVFLWMGVNKLRRLGDSQPSIYPQWAAFANDGKTLAVQYADYGPHSRGPLVKLWDVASGQELVSFNNYNWTVYIGLTGNDQALTSSNIMAEKTSKPGDAYTVWDLATNHVLGTMPARRILAFSPDGKTMLAKEVDAGNPYYPDIRDSSDLIDTMPLELWDIATGNLKYSFEQPTDIGTLATFSPDGQLLAVTTMNTDPSSYRVRLWNVATGEERLKLPTDWLSAITFAPSGKTLASAGWGKITFWDVATGNARGTFALPIEGVFDMDFSPDGRLLALPDNHAHVIRLWDTVTQSERLTFNFGYPDEVLKIAFSPSGEILASGEGYGTIKLWHVATGEELATLRGPHVRMTGLAFLPDGTRLASSSADGTVRVWGVP